MVAKFCAAVGVSNHPIGYGREAAVQEEVVDSAVALLGAGEIDEGIFFREAELSASRLHLKPRLV